MVSFDLFGSKKKKKVPLSHFAEIAKKMLESGKSQQEVAAWLKAQGLKNEHIDAVMRHIIKQAASSPKPPSVHHTPQQTTHHENLEHALTPPMPSLSPQHIEHTATTPQPTMPQQPVAEEISAEDEFLMELEEVIDLVLKTKYGDLTKLKESIDNIEGRIKKMEKDMLSMFEEINKKIKEVEGNAEAQIKDIHNKIENLVPRLNALETAFKDNVPLMLDELRKIEEKIGYHPSLKDKKEEEKEQQKNQQDEKKELFDLKELMKGE